MIDFTQYVGQYPMCEQTKHAVRQAISTFEVQFPYLTFSESLNNIAELPDSLFVISVIGKKLADVPYVAFGLFYRHQPVSKPHRWLVLRKNDDQQYEMFKETKMINSFTNSLDYFSSMIAPLFAEFHVEDNCHDHERPASS